MSARGTDAGYCKFFNRPGGCHRGNECRFKHPTVPCKHFSTPEGCKRGTNCTYAHNVLPPTGAPTQKKRSTLTVNHGGDRGSRSPSPASRGRSHSPGVGRGNNKSPHGSPLVVKKKTVVKTVKKDPFEITFVIDCSSSMSKLCVGKSALEHCKDAVVEIFDVLRPQDKVNVFAFNHKTPNEVTGMKSKAEHGNGFRAAIDPMSTDGGTALYDAIAYTIDASKNQRQCVRKIVIFTDGDDQHSKTYSRENRPSPALKEKVERPGYVVEILVMAMAAGCSERTLSDLSTLATNPHYKFRRVNDIGDIIEGFRFFKEQVWVRTTVAETVTTTKYRTTMQKKKK